jgi:hypothetical protein
VPVPSRAFLFKGQSPDRTAQAVGFVVLASPPSRAQERTYKAVCESYLRGLRSAGELSRFSDIELITNYWPLKLPRSAVVQESCDTLIRNYDYELGMVLATRSDRSGSTGPLLVAVHGPSGYARDKMLVVDLARTDPSKMDEVFARWRARVTQDPKVWRQANGLTRFASETIGLFNELGAALELESAKSIWSLFFR